MAADACEMKGLPPTIICGEVFSLQLRLADVFKNGIVGQVRSCNCAPVLRTDRMNS
jgi:3-deoxy-D-arabino-heptulosonate 7-phosphate (DAHP) synthase class II